MGEDLPGARASGQIAKLRTVERVLGVVMLGDQVLDDVAVDVGQAELATLIFEGEALIPPWGRALRESLRFGRWPLARRAV